MTPLLEATVRHYDTVKQLGFVRLATGGPDIFFRLSAARGIDESALVVRRKVYVTVGIDRTKRACVTRMALLKTG